MIKRSPQYYDDGGYDEFDYGGNNYPEETAESEADYSNNDNENQNV